MKIRKLISLILALTFVIAFAIIPASAASASMADSTISGTSATFSLVVSGDSKGVGSIDVDLSVDDGTISSVSSDQGTASGTSHVSFMAQGKPSSVTLKIKVTGISGSKVKLSYSGLDAEDATDYESILSGKSGSATAEKPTTTEKTTKATTEKVTKATTEKTTKATTAKAEKTTAATTERVTSVVDVTTKAPTIVPLATLNVFGGEDVSPKLKDGVYSYDVTVPYGTTSLKIDASAVADGAKVEVIGADKVKNGSTVKVNVTAADGDVTVYTLNIKEGKDQTPISMDKSGLSTLLTIILILVALIAGLVIGLILGLVIGKKKYDTREQFVYEAEEGSENFMYGAEDDVASPFGAGYAFASTGFAYADSADDVDAPVEDTADDAADNQFAAPVFPSFAEAQAAPVAPVAPVEEPAFAAPAPIVEPTFAAPVAPVEPVAPIEEPVAPVVEPAEPVFAAPVVEPAEPVFAAPVAPVAPVEPVAPVAEPAEPVFAAPVAPVAPVEPVAPVAEPAEPISGLGLINASLNEAPAAPVAEPVAEPAAPEIPQEFAAAPVAPAEPEIPQEFAAAPAVEPTSFAAPVAPIAEPVAVDPVLPTFNAAPVTPAEPATPFYDDAPPVLPYEAGKTLGEITNN